MPLPSCASFLAGEVGNQKDPERDAEENKQKPTETLTQTQLWPRGRCDASEGLGQGSKFIGLTFS